MKNIENTFEEKGYSHKEVLESSLKYFKGDELAATTWINKYALSESINGKDSPEERVYFELTPDDMHKRMATEFARIESNYIGSEISKKGLSKYGESRDSLDEDKIYNLFKGFNSVIPQGSVMSSLGKKDTLASLSNCVVVDSPVDSYGGIFYTDQQLAQLFKRRCGVGTDLSNLRPSGADVNNSANTTSGAASFMERFSNTTREVAQNGRRGALMLTMDIAHPDVEDFVTVKQDLTKITGANVSLRISDEFMEAVRDGKKYTHRWPIDSENPEITKEVDARTLYDTIVKCAHNTAEPGLIFWDRQHDYSTSSVYPGFKNESTNPCSEIAMQGGDSCRLIAINMSNFVKNPFTKKSEFDFEKFYQTTYESQRLMDDLVDLELEAVKRILKKNDSDKENAHIKDVEKRTWERLYDVGKSGRRTGLGFTAMADTIASMGYGYDSEEAKGLVEKIMKTKLRGEFDSSIDMAIERGKFEGFSPKYENTSEFIQMMEKEFPEQYDRMMENGRRNISISTVAPTGSLSMLAQSSAGIEPVFLLDYARRRKINGKDTNIDKKKIKIGDDGEVFEEFQVYHHGLEEWMKINNRDSKDGNPYEGSTAPEIDWVKRVEMQALVQKYTTHSISSTINLPKDVDPKKVGEIYMEAWKKGTKGITVYRDGSRSGILVSNEDKGLEEKVKGFPSERPESVEAKVHRFNNTNEKGETEKWIGFLGMINGRPYELFTGKEDENNLVVPKKIEEGRIVKVKNGTTHYDFKFMTKYGHDEESIKKSPQFEATVPGISHIFNEEYWGYSKLTSGMLQSEMPLEKVIDLINGIKTENDGINSWKAGFTRTLKPYVKNGATSVDKECGECEDPEGLIYEEGCLKCKSCGHTKCG